MIVLFSPQHERHCPEVEIFRGDRVPCFETVARAEYVRDALESAGHDFEPPHLDSSEILSLVHEERYLTFLKTAWQQWIASAPESAESQPFPSVWPIRTLRSDHEPENFIAKLGLYSMDNGSPLSEGTWVAAKSGADIAVSSAKRLMDGTPGVFCATRPPGHHAGADFMGGYSFLNNAAIAAQALRNFGSNRVAILDVDYHHGNGTQSIFYERDDVLFVSIHGDPRTEYPFYLGHANETGSGAGEGFTKNIPLAQGATADAWFESFEAAADSIRAHGSDSLVISLGLDAYVGDPISTFSLETEDFFRLGAEVRRLDLPTTFILEGGYATEQLGTCAAKVVAGFES